ncbi:hypothetical protein ACOMHN_007481 [Nucella lapillus]
MFFTYFLLAVLACLLAVFYRQRRRQMRLFKDMGIPGPEPNFLFGNLLAFKDKMMFERYMEWHQTYGETFGYFEGPTPVLVTANADALQQVFVKQFNNFHSRKLWPVQPDPDESEDVHLFFAHGQRWKRLRSIVNPAFTASKLRKMEPQINKCAERMVGVVDSTAQQSDEQRVELLSMFRGLTLSIIVGCAFGLDEDGITNPNNAFRTHCQAIIDDTANQPVLYTLGFLFPTLNKLWMWVYKFMHNIRFNPVFWLEDRLKEVLQFRRQSPQRNEDLLQQFLDAQIPVESFHDLERPGQQKEGLVDENGNCVKTTFKSLTESEVLAHCFLMMLAGYETSSTTLAYFFYELAVNPHVQEELRKEILETIPEGTEPTYDLIRKLKYMDMVIQETLRKYPVASTVIARKCQEQCQVGSLTIPSGLLIQANVWALHADPTHWGPDPTTFDPTRFSPEQKAGRHSIAWMPFGSGPRMCVGQRFAFMQIKMVTAHLLRRYAFLPASDLQTPLLLKEGATILPRDGVPVRAVRLP